MRKRRSEGISSIPDADPACSRAADIAGQARLRRARRERGVPRAFGRGQDPSRDRARLSRHSEGVQDSHAVAPEKATVRETCAAKVNRVWKLRLRCSWRGTI